MNEPIIQFRLNSISTQQFAILEENYQEGREVVYAQGAAFGFEADARQILALFRISFKQEEEVFLLVEAGCIFDIVDASWEVLFDSATRTCRLPKGFALHLASIVVGVARGILHTRTESTQFGQYLVPLVNLADLIPEDVVIEEEPAIPAD
jgi:hypothetical protein